MQQADQKSPSNLENYILPGWPKIFRSRLGGNPPSLVLGNLESQVGITTGWKPLKDFLEIPRDSYAIMGQLYNPSLGLSGMVGNTLGNTNLHYWVLAGSQIKIARSLDAVLAFKNEGVEERADGSYGIKGIDGIKLSKTISLELYELVRQNIEVIDIRNQNASRVSEVVSNLPRKDPWGYPIEVEEPRAERQETYPSEGTHFVIREPKVWMAWPRILYVIRKFGNEKQSQYGEDQREIDALNVVIYNENPSNIDYRDFLPHSKEDISGYMREFLNPEKGDSVYTYGNRLVAYFGFDQIEACIDELKRAKFSRRAFALTWDPKSDLIGETKSDPPCLDSFQFLIQDDRLSLTTYIRSNDMFNAWVNNAFGLLAVLDKVASAVGVNRGNISTVSKSAHIYQSAWDRTNEILDAHYENLFRSPYRQDPRGNLHIYLGDELIKFTHLHPITGEPLKEYVAKNADEAEKIIEMEELVSLRTHAFYLGREFEKAERALREGLPYTQG
ncbi:MAG: thymidylate synthase [Nanoarchaeota archaeon]